MEFLVLARVSLPHDAPALGLLEAEQDVGAELMRAGILKRIWRIPGTQCNYGVWEAVDATELHERLSSLPLSPFMRFEVQPLAVHPVEALLKVEAALNGWRDTHD